MGKPPSFPDRVAAPPSPPGSPALGMIRDHLPALGRTLLGLGLMTAFLALVAVPVYALVVSEAASRALRALGASTQSITIATPANQISPYVSTAVEIPELQSPFPGPHLTLQLIVQGLDPDAGVVRCRGQVLANGTFLQGLVDTDPSTSDASRTDVPPVPITEPTQGATFSGFRLREPYADAQVTLVFLPTYQPGTVSLPVPLIALVEQTTYTIPQEILLPVSSGSRLYPDDRYVLAGHVGASFSSPFLQVAISDPREQGVLIPGPGAAVDVQVASSSAMVGRDLIVARNAAYAHVVFEGFGGHPVGLWQRVEGRPTILTVATDTLTRVYTYLIGIIPILFGLVLAHMRFSPHGRERSQSPDFLIGAVVGTLAVLPLRQILVPAELRGLTRLDFLLGLGVGTVVGIALLGYGILVLRDAVRQAGGVFVLRVALLAVLAVIVVGGVWRSGNPFDPGDPAALPSSVPEMPAPPAPTNRPFGGAENPNPGILPSTPSLPVSDPFLPPMNPGAQTT